MQFISFKLARTMVEYRLADFMVGLAEFMAGYKFSCL